MKKAYKLTAMLTIFMLLVNTSMPVIANSITNETSETTQSNVEFDAKINNSQNVILDIDNGGTIDLSVKVSNTGYLKDVKVIFEGNNYEIASISDKNIKGITGNTLELNQINAGDAVKLGLPIKLSKTDKVQPEMFDKDSKITLEATYINENNKEEKVSKVVNEHVKWTSANQAKIETSLKRYIKYEANKTLLTIDVTDGIIDNKIPALSKTITMIAPKLNSTLPTKAIVVGNGISYKYENGVLAIVKLNSKDVDGYIAWNSTDMYEVTYIYDTVSQGETITADTSTNIINVNNVELTAKADTQNFEVKEQIGNIVEASITGTDEISKGYMYSNLTKQDQKIETEYYMNYVINVGYSDVLDEIDINETSDKNYSIDKKISISLDELNKVLGENGTIKILSKDGTQLAILNKDNLNVDINNIENVYFVTSKPIAEGNINIKVSKAIKSDLNLSKEEIKALESINNKISVVGKISNNIISTKEVTKTILLKEPTSKATIDINNKNLSTVTKNTDVVISATLETNDVTDALYTNPTLDITLPSEVKNIELTDAKLLYEDELVPASFTTDGNKIKLALTGTQTKYSSQVTATGSVIRIVANLTLDNLSPSKTEAVSLAYSNEATGEVNTVVATTNIVAPTGFVTTDSLTVGSNTVTSQETDEELAKIRAFGPENEATITGTIVNNLGADATGFSILGRILFKGNTTPDGNKTNLNSTFDTTINSPITTTLDSAKIYYSSNAEATTDTSLDTNGWTETYSNIAKSYLIVATNSVANETNLTFNYKVTIPRDLDYAQISKGSFAVYYDNNAAVGTTKSVVLAAAVGLKTSAIPVIETEITATDYNTGKIITKDDKIVPGEYIKYKIIAKNTGKEKAVGVKAQLSIDSRRTDITDNNLNKESGSGIVSYGYDYNEDIVDISSINESSSQSLPDIEAGQSTSIDVVTYVSATIHENSIYSIISAITATNADAESDMSFTNTAGAGVVNLKLASSSNGKAYNEGDLLSYSLYVNNYSLEEKKNIVVTVAIPDGLTFNSGDKAEYNSSKKTLTYTIDSLASYGDLTYSFELKANSTDTKDQNVSIYATATYDGTTDTVQSNAINSTIGYVNGVKAQLTSNIPEGYMLDTDTLEYYLTVTNTSKTDVTVNLTDVIPDKLKLISYTIQNSSDVSTKQITTSTVTTQQTLKSMTTIKLTLVTTPYLLDTKDSTAVIENSPIVKVNNTTIDVNSLKHTIKGTRDFNKSDVTTDPNNDINNNYSISGIAWVDKNGNGKQDDDEEKLSGITFKLYSKATKDVAIDKDGIEIKATSDNDGRYVLNNIPSGEYVVVAEYDTITYAITKYQTTGVGNNENSDFIEATIDNTKKVAATNIMSIENSNLYNIDLGLNPGKRFDLELDKSITKVVVTNPSVEKQSTDYDNKKLVKCELVGKTIDKDTVLVQYSIKVTNAGNVAGYAKSIVDYIPDGMTFNSELNSDWYMSEDKVYNNALANTIINPGETKEITLVLTRKMNGNNVGMVHNIAEIAKEYNELGLEDVDSIPDNKKDGEDDISSADVFISIKTGARNLAIAGISLGILGLIGLAVYEIKKHVIK